jgi:hypothetical protein
MNRASTMLAVAVVGLASAAHAEAWQSLGPEDPSTSVTIELEAVGFSLSGVRGRYSTQAVSAQYAPFPVIAFDARIPSHFMSLTAAPAYFGLGDMELGAQVKLAGEKNSSSLILGTQVRFPTGDSARGLGSGNFAIIPYLTGGVAFGVWSFGATLGAEVAVEPPDTPVLDLVNPNSDRELFGELGAAFGIDPHTFLFAEVDTVYPRTGDELGLWLVRGSLGAGITPSEYARMMLKVSFPLAGPHRAEWQVLFTLAFLFPSEP